MTIDFAKLSLLEALDLAVLVEEEARDRYEELTHQMETHHTPDAAKFFSYMAQNEEKHRAALWERRQQLFAGKPVSMRREMIWDVEAPEYHTVKTFMTQREALTVAMKSEVKAHGFFAEATPKVTDPDVKALFLELQEEEVHHQQLVQKELDKCPADDGFDIEDFADEPVTVD